MTKCTISTPPGLISDQKVQRLGMHVRTGCDGTSYPYAKCEVCALKTMLAGDFSDLDDVLGEEGVTHADLMKMATTFCIAMYALCHGSVFLMNQNLN